jgi:xanthine dehydrogenase accessory factor
MILHRWKSNAVVADRGQKLIERLPYQLCTFFWEHSSLDRPLALITVLSTEGSTYSKAGSQMLVDDEGDFQGMLSGGCLEGDLAERSKNVIAGGVAEVITYDLRADDDVFGLGVGCEGALRILIQPLSAEAKYEPFATLVEDLGHAPHADMVLADAESEIGVTRVMAPLRLLILGAGQDADPLITFTVALGWEVAVSDHRPAAIDRLGGSGAASVECVPLKDIASHFDLGRYDAVIVMSHNLEADRVYLTALADAQVDFVGLLGPPHRRDRLLREIGSAADELEGRLRGPVGKQIGGRGPAAIALEIAAELQSYFSSGHQA